MTFTDFCWFPLTMFGLWWRLSAAWGAKIHRQDDPQAGIWPEHHRRLPGLGHSVAMLHGLSVAVLAPNYLKLGALFRPFSV